MYKANFKAYEGSNPYIFISYAHKDSEAVYPIISQLNAEGYRVWYDDGISAGSEWPEYIARHLDKCEAVVFFASPNSISSDNCRREVNFAMSRSKKFISIVLEPTDFTLGMELQLSSQQSIMKYELPDDETFYAKLLTSPSLEMTRRAFGEVDNVNDTGDYSDIIDEIIDQNMFNSLSTDDSERSDDDYDAPAPDSGRGSKKKVVIPIVTAASCLVLILIIVGVVSVVKNVAFSSPYGKNAMVLSNPGVIIYKNSSTVTIENLTVTDDDIAKIGKCSDAYNLDFKNCDFSQCTNLSKLAILDAVKYFSLEDCTGITDYSFTSKLTACTKFGIKATDGCTDLSFLSALPALDTVVIEDIGNIDISPLLSIPMLRSINVKNCELKPINYNTKNSLVDTICLSNCGLSDISFCNNYDSLRNVDLSYNNLSDFSSLLGCADSLMSINISGTTPSNDSLQMLSQFEHLSYFYGNDIKFEDLSFIKDWEHLIVLSLANCDLDTVYPDLLDNKKLMVLDLSYNKLQTVPQLNPNNYNENSAFELNLSNNQITDLSGLPQCAYNFISVYGNKIDYSKPGTLDVLKNKIYSLYIDYNQSFDSVCSDINANTITLVDCSADAIRQYDGNYMIKTKETTESMQNKVDAYGYDISAWEYLSI